MKNKLVFIGAGGHARSVLDILLEMDIFDIVGCISTGNEKVVLGVPVIGNDSLLPDLYRQGVEFAFVAMGDNKHRSELFQHCKNIGFQIANVISSHAIISERVALGCGICVLPGAIVRGGTTIGDYTIINTGAVIDHDCSIDKGCHIAGNTYLAGNVTIGEQTLIAPGATVRDGIRIGKGSVVGLGSVVTKNIEENVVAYGVPACVVRR